MQKHVPPLSSHEALNPRAVSTHSSKFVIFEGAGTPQLWSPVISYMNLVTGPTMFGLPFFSGSLYVPDSDNGGESLGVTIVLKVFALTFTSFARC